MALPTITCTYLYLYQNSPNRTFYQSYVSGATMGVLKVLGTISSSNGFILTDFMTNVVLPTDAAVVTIKINNEPVYQFSGAPTSTNNFTTAMNCGIKANGADTNTVEVLIESATATVSFYGRGFFD